MGPPVHVATRDPRLFRLLGAMFLDREEHDRAITCFRRALARADSDFEAERGLRLVPRAATA